MIVKGEKTFKRTIENILIIQLGDIGDVVWATPTFKAVKDAYPRAKVAVLLRSGFGSLLTADPSVDKVFEVERYKGTVIEKTRVHWSFIRSLRKEHFDLAFDLRSDDRGAYMAVLSGAPLRVSIIYNAVRWRNRFFTHLADPPPLDKTKTTAAEQSLRVVKAFGIEPADEVPKIYVSKDAADRARRLCLLEGLSEDRWITVNPFSRWRYKEWNDDKWAEIIDWLWGKHRASVVMLGSDDERERSENIARKCHGHVCNLTGMTTLAELAGVLRHSRLHIGVDSAAPHIAAAVGTPTVTIYGPSDWRDWAHGGGKHSIILPDDICVPCGQKGCDGSGNSRCLENLTVDKVKKAIQESLYREGLCLEN
ncbi:MAG: putative lipopolysaccharide heptosyltransferase III [Deltaproteobacteria bacterium]|nr:putative lipopolysaccharide heptosyltransferase III [Deltaproteobacteria bacterium]